MLSTLNACAMRINNVDIFLIKLKLIIEIIASGDNRSRGFSNEKKNYVLT